jgi:uncharacterized membrane protein
MSAQSVVVDVVNVLVTIVESFGAAVIAVGAIISFIRFISTAIRAPGDVTAFVPVRLTLGRYLALGLEFQLASDVLRTAVAPTFREIAQLAAIATIRTALNYFLAREISEERRQIREQKAMEAGDAESRPPP